MNELLGAFLAVSSWLTPQPVHSSGLLVVYGNQRLIEANASYRGYDLGAVPGRCGLSAISPAMMGKLAWVRTPGHAWVGPCLTVDAVGRDAAYQSIFVRHEVAEISFDAAHALGFAFGAQGEVYFSVCPPASVPAQPYAPPLRWDTWGEITPALYPVPPQEQSRECPVAHGVME